jgi:hypothetical protein
MAAACAAVLAALVGCAGTPLPPGTQVAAGRLAQAVVSDHTTKSELLATFGPTKNVVFDSGYEAWVYQSPAGGGRYAEFVVLIDPQGVVRKTRQRPPALP